MSAYQQNSPKKGGNLKEISFKVTVFKSLFFWHIFEANKQNLIMMILLPHHPVATLANRLEFKAYLNVFCRVGGVFTFCCRKQRSPRLSKQFPLHAAFPWSASVRQHGHWFLCLPGGSQVNQTHTHAQRNTRTQSHTCSVVVFFSKLCLVQMCLCAFFITWRLRCSWSNTQKHSLVKL